MPALPTGNDLPISALPRSPAPNRTSGSDPVSDAAANALSNSGEVPFRPYVDPARVKAYIADFIPAESRTSVSLDDWGAQREDNPRITFDNNPSNVPWDDTGRFNSSEEFARLFNSTSKKDPARGRVAGVLLNILTLSARYWKREKAIPEGHFRVIETSTGTEVRLRGHHHLLSTLSKWGSVEPIDDEKKDIRTFGNKTILQVRANNLGCAHLVGDKFATDSEGNQLYYKDGSPKYIGRDGDLVLFSQGRYVLDETEYRGIHVGHIDAKKMIIPIGDATILNIPPQYVGGARNRSTNEYRLFQTGAPIVFDNKEWTDYEVKARVRSTFNVGPYTFVTVSADEVACIGHKHGWHMLLTDENTYCFHEQEFATFEKHKNVRDFEVGAYYVNTVEKNQVATVQSLSSGEFKQLRPGKYYLPKKDFAAPDVQTLDKPIVQSGPWTWVRVQEDYRTGGWNAKSGEWVEWQTPGVLVQLHKKDFPVVERIKKVAFEAQAFGPHTVITVADGKWGVFEEDGKIRIEEAGTYTLSHAARILPALPNTPQEFYLTVPFLSKDTINMSVRAAIYFKYAQPKDLAKKLNMTGWTLEEWTRVVEQFCKETIEKKVKAYKHDELYNPDDKEQAAAVYSSIIESCLEDLNIFSGESGMGILFGRLGFTDGFQVKDSEVIRDRAKLTKAEMEAKANKAQAEANRSAAQAEAVAAIEEAEKEKRVKILESEAQMETQKLQLAQARLEAEQQYSLLLAKEETDAKAVKVRAEAEQAVKKLQADAEAYAIKERALAEYERLSAENKAASERPQEEVWLKAMDRYVEASRAAGSAAWAHPEPVVEVLRRAGEAVDTSGLLTIAALTKKPTEPKKPE